MALSTENNPVIRKVAYAAVLVTMRLQVGYVVRMAPRAVLGSPAVELLTVCPMMPYVVVMDISLHQEAHVARMAVCAHRDGHVVEFLTVTLMAGRAAVTAATRSPEENVVMVVDHVLVDIIARSSMESMGVVQRMRGA